MYSPLTIANTAIQMRPGRSPMGVNKIVYLIHGWSLAHGRSVVGELPQLWKYGPIYASLYDALRSFKNNPVMTPQPIVQGATVPIVPHADKETIVTIKATVDVYTECTDLQLSTLAHADRSPWKEEAASRNFRTSLDQVIPEWRLRDHFAGKLAAHQAQHVSA